MKSFTSYHKRQKPHYYIRNRKSLIVLVIHPTSKGLCCRNPLLVLSIRLICELVRKRRVLHALFILINSGQDTCGSRSTSRSIGHGSPSRSPLRGLQSSVTNGGLKAILKGLGRGCRLPLLLAGLQLNNITGFVRLLVKDNNNATGRL